jgi:hypothetical protein
MTYTIVLTDGDPVTRKTSFPDFLSALARASSSPGPDDTPPEVVVKRKLRRRRSRAEGKATRRLFKGFGL